MADDDSIVDAKREARLAYHRAYYAANKDKLLAQSKRYRARNKEAKRKRDKAYYERTRDKRAQYSRSEAAAATRKKYRQSHREELRRRHREWRNNNREHLRSYKKERHKIPVVALMKRVRDRTRDALRAGLSGKNRKTSELLGCSSSELVAWIESKFHDGMCWERISEIHLDHVIPLAAFDLSDEEQQKHAFHYTNLRPMWEIDNKRKSCKLPGQHLFGFAYAAKIAKGMKATAKSTTDASRKHSRHKRRNVPR